MALLLFRRWFLAWCLLVLALGCSSDAPQGRGPVGMGAFGDRCEQTEDCQSGLCVRVDEEGGICSTRCQNASSCPAADNWGCLMADNIAASVCACRLLEAQEVCADGLDNDCDGKVDDCRVCGGKQVLNDDHEHCGACGNACRDDQLCDDGACHCTEGESECSGQCVTLDSSSLNCGSCGNACPAAQFCTAGVCECPVPGNTLCPIGGCVDLNNDATNCGECGTNCTLARTCVAGACQCPTLEAPDFCDGVGCVDFQTSASHCGECGVACGAGLVCQAGECVCPAGQELCGDVCVDTTTDELNCGGCGETCGAQQACIQGSCSCNSFGYSVCGQDCVALTTDPLHCGDCETECAGGERCLSGGCDCQSDLYCDGECMAATDDANCGECGKACPQGQGCALGSCVCDGFGLSVCPAGCVDLAGDEANCGDCGLACRTGELCYSGECDCPAGQTYCESAGKCVSFGNDTANCGSCGNTCDPTEICALGVCKCATAGSLYCSSENSCVDTLQNTEHCGACDKECNPTETCSAGKCGCPGFGQLFCESTDACTDTRSNAQHCGACDKACRATETCSSGFCRCPSSSDTWCQNEQACVTLASDDENCGSCGNDCPAAQHCSASKCVCDTAGLTVCNNACFDLQTDEKHCGVCNNACTGALSCIGGACRCANPIIGAEIRLTDEDYEHVQLSAAFDGTNVGLAYVRTLNLGAAQNLFIARIKPDGTWVGTSKATNYSENVVGVHQRPTLVWNGSEYAVTWVLNADQSGMYEVMFRRMNANGNFAAAGLVIAQSEMVQEGAGMWVAHRYYNNALAWSASYGGYAAAYMRNNNGTTTFFRRLGLDASAPEIQNGFGDISSSDTPLHMAAAPDGTWGILGRRSTNLEFQLINADGSRTVAKQSIATTNSEGPPLIHDGQAFTMAYTASVPGNQYTAIYVNRGTTLNSPAIALQSTVSLRYGAPLLTKTGSALALGYSRSTVGVGARLGMRRFSIPSDSSSAVKPIDDATDIMTTDTLSSGAPGNGVLVATTPGKMLAIWSDTRWGKRALYAAPIDLQSCP